MTHFLEPSDQFKSPEYWDGIDIQDQDQLAAMPRPAAGEWLSKRQLILPHIYLRVALNDIKQGANVDVRYENGTYFNPSVDDMPDGSLLAIEEERLTRHTYTDPIRKITLPNRQSDITTPPISRPIVDYWLGTRYAPQDHRQPPNSAGVEELFYQDDNFKYSRMLWWGVMVKLEKNRRGIQPFSFNGDRAGEYKDHGLNMPVTPVPVSIGEVALRRLQLPPRNDQKQGTRIDTLGRVRGIDIVRFSAIEDIDDDDDDGDAKPIRFTLPRFRFKSSPRLGNA